MKVKVHFAQPTILVKREAYEAEQAEFEKLFQENKDLRVSEAHLRDDLACAQARIEKLTAELNALHAVFADLQIEHQELGEDYDALVKTKCEYAECIDALRQENKRLRNQMSLPEFMRQFIEMTRETVQNEFPDSGNS